MNAKQILFLIALWVGVDTTIFVIDYKLWCGFMVAMFIAAIVILLVFGVVAVYVKLGEE